MAGTKRSRSGSPGGTADSSKAARDSAQKIWLAGLGAFERARIEGPRVFETLVQQGRNMGARAVGAADQALKTMRQAGYSSPQWEKVEKAFEERLTKSLKRLGVLTRDEVVDLTNQVEALNRSLRAYARSPAKAAKGAKKRKARAAKRGAAKTAGKRKASSARKARGGAKRASSGR